MAKDDEEKTSVLNNRDHLFTFLTALVKKNGGQLELTEQEIMNVQKNDLVSVKYDQAGKKIIFEVNTLDDPSSFTPVDPNIRQDN